MGIFAGVCQNTNKLTGKTVIITGANTGVGKETALELANREAKIVMACRNVSKGEEAVIEVKLKSKNENVFFMNLDLSSLISIKSFFEKFIEEFSELHVLINNAGVMICPYSKTEDGFEMQFGVNHLGHFALTNLLLKPMLETDGPKRIINLSSAAHSSGVINLDDINSEKSCSKIGAYAQSKLANILFTEQLHRKLSGTNITGYSVHPGVVNTELGRHTMLSRFLYRTLVRAFFKTPKQGAQTSIYCATEDDIEINAGKYFADCSLKSTNNIACGNEEMAIKLWKISEEMTGVTFPLK